MLDKILLNILNMLIVLYGKTWRYKINTLDYFESKANGNKHVFVTWHNQILPLTFSWRKKNIATVASQSKDGRLITNIIEKWGYVLARGSSSRGGVKALVGLKKLMSEGRDGAITVDGPRGPRYEAKQGAVFLAKISGAKITPVFCTVNRFIQFNSWDKFILPMPFAKINIYFTESIALNDDTAEDVIKNETENLTKIMKERYNEICPNYL